MGSGIGVGMSDGRDISIGVIFSGTTAGSGSGVGPVHQSGRGFFSSLGTVTVCGWLQSPSANSTNASKVVDAKNGRSELDV